MEKAKIKLLYDRLLEIQPSPVVKLNRAVAVAMSESPQHGLRMIDGLPTVGEMKASSC